MLCVGTTSNPITLAYSPNGRHIVTGSEEGELNLWSATTLEKITTFQSTPSDSIPNLTVSFSAESTNIYSADEAGQVVAWDVATRRQLWRWRYSDSIQRVQCRMAALSPDASLFAIAYPYRETQIFETESLKPRGMFAKRYQPKSRHLEGEKIYSSHPRNAQAISSNNRLMAVGIGEQVLLWDTAFPRAPTKLQCSRPVSSVSMATNCSSLFIGARNDLIYLQNFQDASSSRTFKGHESTITDTAFSSDVSMLCSASDDCTVRFWDIRADTQQFNPLTDHAGPVTSVSYSPDGRQIASTCEDGKLRVWDTRMLYSTMLTSGVESPVFQTPHTATFRTVQLPKGLAQETKPTHTARHWSISSLVSVRSEPPINSARDVAVPRTLSISSAPVGGITWRNLPTVSSEPEEFDVVIFREKLSMFSNLENDPSSAMNLTGLIEVGAHVGGGQYGDVHKGRWKNLPLYFGSAPDVAVKIIRPMLFQDSKTGAKTYRNLEREVEVWLSLRHDNIVPFVGIISSPQSDAPSLVSQWMHNGTVGSYLASNSYADVIGILRGIARGIEYLHDQDPSITHGDIKAENVMVDDKGNPRLGDFGLSRIVADASLWRTTATSALGTTRWMAPELLSGHQPIVNHSTDVYAFGVTSWEIITGDIPFPHYKIDAPVITAVVQNHERPARPESSLVSDKLWRLWTSCWSAKPDERPLMRRVCLTMDAVVKVNPLRVET